MESFEALYQAMYDDLKDSDMMIEYAHEIKEHKERKHIADELAKYAQFRLNHFKEFHKIFVQEATKEKGVSQKTVSDCMWHKTHEHLQEWHDHIKKKIETY